MFENIILKLFCLHKWDQIEHIEEISEFDSNKILGHIFIYACDKCGKIKKVKT